MYVIGATDLIGTCHSRTVTCLSTQWIVLILQDHVGNIFQQRIYRPTRYSLLCNNKLLTGVCQCYITEESSPFPQHCPWSFPLLYLLLRRCIKSQYFGFIGRETELSMMRTVSGVSGGHIESVAGAVWVSGSSPLAEGEDDLVCKPRVRHPPAATRTQLGQSPPTSVSFNQPPIKILILVHEKLQLSAQFCIA